MTYQYYIMDVFSDAVFGGNQLAVLPDARGLTPGLMQKVAREFNFSETAFVLPAEEEDTTACVRIFTPRAEVDFAGHPTIGAACALVHGGYADMGRLTLAENIGQIAVTVERKEDTLYGTLVNSSRFEYVADGPSATDLAKVLSLPPDAIVECFFASAGLRFCFIRLADWQSVDAAVVDRQAWTEHLSRAWSSNLYFFSGELADKAKIYARLSALALGVEEDPATGSAAAALAGAIAGRNAPSDREISIDVVQGVAMGRPGNMTAGAQWSDGSVSWVSVGGPAKLFAKGELAPLDDHP